MELRANDKDNEEGGVMLFAVNDYSFNFLGFCLLSNSVKISITPLSALKYMEV